MGKLFFFGGSFLSLRRQNQPRLLAEPSHSYAREAIAAPWSRLLACETMADHGSEKLIVVEPLYLIQT
jgi:hypothetical protein